MAELARYMASPLSSSVANDDSSIAAEMFRSHVEAFTMFTQVVVAVVRRLLQVRIGVVTERKHTAVARYRR